jgi:polysaccharide pyruvyl transferase WcaK-like protein
MNRLVTECISWRWHGNLGDDMLFAAQEAMFADSLELGQYWDRPEALVGGGTFVPKALEHPELVRLSQKLPTAFFGTGIGDPLFWGEKHIPDWLEVIRNSRLVSVRGPLSQERLLSWGVSSESLDWIGDPAIYFAKGDAIPREFGANLAVNLGITYGQLYGFDEEQLESTIILALEQLARKGWNITLVCAWAPDDIVVDRIRARVPVCAVEHWHDDYERALDSVEKFDIVLSQKLHVSVAAACRAVPFIALNYRSKVRDFCRSIDWEQFCVDTNNLDRDALLDLAAVLAEARYPFAVKLQQSVSKLRERLLQAVPRTVAALAGAG